MRTVRTALLAIVAVLAAGLPRAEAQVEGTSADIQRLERGISQASTEIAALRQSDAQRAARLSEELDELREEVIYLRVRARREGRVPRAEYSEVRDRLEDLRSRARGEGAAARTEPPQEPRTPAARDDRPAARPEATRGEARTIPVGQELDVRLQRPLGSDTAQVEDRFEATTVVDLLEGDQVLVPSGSVLRGVVTSVNRAGRIDRKGALSLAFDQITVRGQTYPLRATVTQALESGGIRDEAGRIGTGAGVGAVLGGILGGVRGALAGILIGGGGVVAATEGKDVHLPAGTILRLRIDSPVTIK